MRICCDTNVLIAAYLWPEGRCHEVLEIIWAEHDFITSEVILDELSRKLAEKFQLSTNTIAAIDSELRFFHVEPRPMEPYEVQINDPDDPWVLAAAVNARAKILVTGDKELRGIDENVPELQIVLPREFVDAFGAKPTTEPG